VDTCGPQVIIAELLERFLEILFDSISRIKKQGGAFPPPTKVGGFHAYLYMKLKVIKINFEFGRVVVLNAKDALKVGRAGDRVLINLDPKKKKSIISILDIYHSESIVKPGEIGVYLDLMKEIKELEYVSIKPADPPDSFKYIKKKVQGNKLTNEEINSIIYDTASRRLSQIELATFVTAVQINGMDIEEMTSLTLSEARTGEVFDFGTHVFDKHSTGGVPGNKVTLIIVPIIAAAGLTIPKSSTRAITSPSGTADSMEVLAPVTFNSEELKKIIENERACIIWGGALETAPADNILIEIERPLRMDPVGLMIPSIISKKLSLGVKELVLDIPVGPGTKFSTPDDGAKFAHLFKEISKNVGIETECALTLAHQPIGHTAGPALEAKEALTLLRDYSAGPNSLIEKSTGLAGILLEMGGKAQKGEGQNVAKDLLKSGKAYEKMKRIIEIQGGDPEIKPEDIKIGPYEKNIYALKAGHITEVQNAVINEIAKATGCPTSKGAGIQIYKKQGARIKEDDLIFKIYAESQSKLKKAIEIFNKSPPQVLGGMLIKRI